MFTVQQYEMVGSGPHAVHSRQPLRLGHGDRVDNVIHIPGELRTLGLGLARLEPAAHVVGGDVRGPHVHLPAMGAAT